MTVYVGSGLEINAVIKCDFCPYALCYFERTTDKLNRLETGWNSQVCPYVLAYFERDVPGPGPGYMKE